MARRKACSICRREGHDRRAHTLDAGLLGRRVVMLGSIELTVEARGNLSALSVEDRAVLFAVSDLVNDAIAAREVPVADPIKLLIYGSRTWAPSVFEVQAAAVDLLAPGVADVMPSLIVVSGNARGADRAGEAWAASMAQTIERHPANWTTYGKAAGPIRNALMATIATHAIGFRDDGESRGTDEMTARLKARGTPHRVYSRADVRRLVDMRSAVPRG